MTPWRRICATAALLASAPTSVLILGPVHAQQPGASEDPANDIPEGFEVMATPGLTDVQRRKAHELQTDVAIGNELRYSEQRRQIDRYGRATFSIYDGFYGGRW